MATKEPRVKTTQQPAGMPQHVADWLMGPNAPRVEAIPPQNTVARDRVQDPNRAAAAASPEAQRQREIYGADQARNAQVAASQPVGRAAAMPGERADRIHRRGIEARTLSAPPAAGTPRMVIRNPHERAGAENSYSARLRSSGGFGPQGHASQFDPSEHGRRYDADGYVIPSVPTYTQFSPYDPPPADRQISRLDQEDGESLMEWLKNAPSGPGAGSSGSAPVVARRTVATTPVRQPTAEEEAALMSGGGPIASTINYAPLPAERGMPENVNDALIRQSQIQADRGQMDMTLYNDALAEAQYELPGASAREHALYAMRKYEELTGGR